MRYALVIAIGVLSLCSLWGCSSGSTHPNAVPTVPVTAVVTYQDEALEGAIVTFVAEGGAYSSSGVTNSQGKATMGTFGEGDGVVPGKYRVTVRKIQVGNDSTDEATSGDPADHRGAVKHLVPLRYSQPTKSGLTADIAPEGSQEVNLALSN